MFHTLALAACGCSCVCNSVLKQCSAVGRLSHFSSRSQPPSENDLYRSRVADGQTTKQLRSGCSPKSQQYGFPPVAIYRINLLWWRHLARTPPSTDRSHYTVKFALLSTGLSQHCRTVCTSDTFIQPSCIEMEALKHLGTYITEYSQFCFAILSVPGLD